MAGKEMLEENAVEEKKQVVSKSTKSLENKTAKKFSREKLEKSKAFEGRQDILNIVIANDETVTIDEANLRIDKFLQKEVK